jgi:hypothetical protein
MALKRKPRFAIVNLTEDQLDTAIGEYVVRRRWPDWEGSATVSGVWFAFGPKGMTTRAEVRLVRKASGS